MPQLKNKFEKKLDKQLKKSKLDYLYESEKIPYILARNYIPDFTVFTPSGKLYIEGKGFLRPEHRAKLAAVKRQHPEKDIRIVFYSNNKKYKKWAEKTGFQYAVGEIPDEWLH